MSFYFKTILGGTVAALALAQAGVVHAQTTADTAAAKADATPATEVIVTGRAGIAKRTKADTSYSVTRIDNNAIRLQGASSVTESLKSVPGFWVESTGGEASGNVRARGVPVDGYGSINLLEDGIPVQHDPALGYLNADQVFRLDETIDRIEVVRGGPSTVFYSNAPAGAVNYISRKVGDDFSGLIKQEIGSDGLYRTDFWVGAPIGGDWKLAAGGFYRSETGVRDPGYTGNLGGQMRVTLSRDFDRGSFSLDVKSMNDKVIFYTDDPMYTDSAGKIVAVPGFNASTGTLAGPETAHVSMIQGDGSTYNYDNTLGTDVKRTQITGHFTYEVADGWNFKSTMRATDTTTQRNGYYANTLESASTFLASEQSILATVPGAKSLQLNYVNTPSQVFNNATQNGNGDVIIAGLRALTIPVQEFMADDQLSHRFNWFGDHDVTFGYYFEQTNEQFSRYSTDYLTDVQNQARLLNITAVDASGNVLKTVTTDGALRYGYEWANAAGAQTDNAFYFSDEWQITPELRLDGGIRYEDVNTKGSVEGSQTVNLGTFSTSAILTGNGQWSYYDASYKRSSWTLGANYQFTPTFGVFGRYSYADRLPGLANYVTSANATPIVQTMDLGEVGVKYYTRTFEAYATGFYTKYNDVSFTNYVFNPVTSTATQQSLYADTETYGLELDANYRPLNIFSISGVATLENPEYKDFTYHDANNVSYNFNGNQLIRVPKVSARIVPALHLMHDTLQLQAAVEYEGKRYVDTANTVVLPAYTSINLSGQFLLNDRITLNAYVDNLTNSLGLTEGNPRAGEVISADAGQNSFLARPLLGREYRVSLMYKF